MGEKIAAGPRQGAAAGEKRPRYSAGTAHSHDPDVRAFREAIHGLDGRQLRFTISVVPTIVAMLDPQFGPYAVEMVRRCGLSAREGGDLQCHACLRQWSADRHPAMVGIVEFLDLQGHGGLAGLCQTCCGGPDLQKLVAEGLARDFGFSTVECRFFGPGGRA